MIQNSHIWNSFFEKIILGIQSFYICPYAPVNIIRVFILILDFLAGSFKADKNQQKILHILQYSFAQNTHFANLNSLDIENNMLPQTQPKTFLTVQIFSKHVSVQCQKKYLYCTISWHPRTAFFKHIESKCLHISIYLLNKILVHFQRRSKVLFNKRRDGRG